MPGGKTFYDYCSTFLKYAGRWFEIYRYQQPFTVGCICTNVNYIPEADKVKVRNCCHRNGNSNCLEGSAVISYPHQEPLEGKLNVTFFGRKREQNVRWKAIDYQQLQRRPSQTTGCLTLITRITRSFISARTSHWTWPCRKSHSGYCRGFKIFPQIRVPKLRPLSTNNLTVRLPCSTKPSIWNREWSSWWVSTTWTETIYFRCNYDWKQLKGGKKARRKYLTENQNLKL